jgi:solute carrier family 45, member 3
MALMSHNMFCTDYVATVVYGGKPEAERGSLEDIRFDEGVRMGSLGLLLHSITGKGLLPHSFSSSKGLF